MKFAPLFSVLATFTLPLSTLATPLLGLDTGDLLVRDLYVDSSATCRDIVYGATATPSGRTCVGIKDGTLTVTTNAESGWVINKVHVLVSTSTPTLAIPGQFPYKSDNGFCTISGTTSTCSIPVDSAWRQCDKELFIVVHVDATSPAGVQQTGWGSGKCYDAKGNCAKFWTFTNTCICPAIYDFQPITTTSTFITTITSSKVYTITFPQLTTTESCKDAYPATATAVYTTTTTLPADWKPPMVRK